MNQAHYHLLLNHLPIIIPIVGLLVLTVGFIFKSEIVKRTAFAVFILAALTAIAAFATGDGAGEVIKNLPGVNEQVIHDHEEVAETFSILIYVLGGTSLIALWLNWKQKTYASLFAVIVMALAIVVIFFAKQTGTTGGIIRHTEIRTDSMGKQNLGNKNENDD